MIKAALWARKHFCHRRIWRRWLLALMVKCWAEDFIIKLEILSICKLFPYCFSNLFTNHDIALDE